MITGTSTEQYGKTGGLLRDDVIRVPSNSRQGLMWDVSVNVLIGATTGCTCEAGQKREMCAHRREVDANEGAWGFARCRTCQSLMRLEFWNTRSGGVRVWLCPLETETEAHGGHEAGTAVLYRTGSRAS